MHKPPIFVTGVAGFIGAALVNKLLSCGEEVIGIDNLNSYYDVELKKARLQNIFNSSRTLPGKFIFHQIDLQDYNQLDNLLKESVPNVIVHLAAQAGVRYSITNPRSYLDSNLIGFFNILELARKFDINNLIYASSSSVYGGNTNIPFKEEDPVNHPVSLYASTKKSNELMAHSYSHLYGIPCTGLRFFTVYGPWGRPDMAPILFAKAILNNEPIQVFNHGKMKRDFTYIDDIVEGIFLCCYKPATIDNKFDSLKPSASTSFSPHRIFNIGNSQPVELLYFIELLETYLGRKAKKIFKSMQMGDVVDTAADTRLLNSWVNFQPKTSIEQGVELFTKWYRGYHC